MFERFKQENKGESLPPASETLQEIEDIMNTNRKMGRAPEIKKGTNSKSVEVSEDQVSKKETANRLDYQKYAAALNQYPRSIELRHYFKDEARRNRADDQAITAIDSMSEKDLAEMALRAKPYEEYQGRNINELGRIVQESFNVRKETETALFNALLRYIKEHMQETVHMKMGDEKKGEMDEITIEPTKEYLSYLLGEDAMKILESRDALKALTDAIYNDPTFEPIKNMKNTRVNFRLWNKKDGRYVISHRLW